MTEVAFFDSDDLDGHVDIIRRQIQRSLRDRETHLLARAIVEQKADAVIDGVPIVYAWGEPHQLGVAPGEPARTELEQIHAVWNFTVLNVQYEPDPTGFDMFSTAHLTLDARQGDCFPEGTLLLRADGAFVPIEEVQRGDRIHDGTSFVPVTQTWTPKRKPMVQIRLNNGATLRLSADHHVWRMPRKGKTPGTYGTEERVRVSTLRPGDDLLQPRIFHGGTQELSEDEAFLTALYLAEGCTTAQRPGARPTRISLAGVHGGKGLRERAETTLDRMGVPYQSRERELRFAAAHVPFLDWQVLGRTARDKRLPHLDWGPRTAKILFETLEAADGGVATNGTTVVFSSISRELAQQYRVLARTQGYSTSMTCVADHKGAGRHAIYRVTRRSSHSHRPWAKIRSLTTEEALTPCYDITTETSKVYLPEADVIVSQCDDMVIVLAALLKALGYRVQARVVSVGGKQWEHIYLRVGLPRKRPSRWMVLDPVVTGATPGWEFQGISHAEDLPL